MQQFRSLGAGGTSPSLNKKSDLFGQAMTTQGVDHYRWLGTMAPARGANIEFGTWAGVAFLLGEFASWVRARVVEEIRYRRALRELRHLGDRDLDDLGIGRAELPELARPHAGIVG
jgi:uncharacterized protein YjiS (DUF1127 family)